VEHGFERESCLERGEDTVGDGGCLDGGADVVDAEDVGSGEDCGYVGSGGGVEPALRGWDVGVKGGEAGVFGEGVAEEAFAGGPDEDGLVELVELVQVGQERVVFVEAFAEAEAGVEDDPVAGNACSGCGFEAGSKLSEDEREYLIWG
jgi:hypothetical protein